MMGGRGNTSSVSATSNPHGAVPAQMIMAKDVKDKGKKKGTIKQEWESGSGSDLVLFKPEEMDIYVNKVTLEAYIFHSKTIDYAGLERLEYDPADHSVVVIRKDGVRMDLGVKIQWLVRPYFTKAQEINIVQTKDGKSIDGVIVPLVHKAKK
jgi:hypothetical protein